MTQPPTGPLDGLKPARHFEYLIAEGRWALVSEWPLAPGAEEPLHLRGYEGRQPLALSFVIEETSEGAQVSVHGERDHRAAPLFLSLIVRLCIRRAANRTEVRWPDAIALAPDDALTGHVSKRGGFACLTGSHVDLRVGPCATGMLYARERDLPWIYDPLDYDVLLPLLADRPRRVLDLGCGNGRNAVALENLGLEVFGVDAAARSWPFCRHPRRFHQASVRDLPFEGGFFDAVLDVGCLHMLFDPGDLSAAAAEIVRVLRQGGVVVGRALKPQSRRWLKAQPFAIPRAGLDPRELAQAFRHLRLDILHDLPGLTYYRVYQP